MFGGASTCKTCSVCMSCEDITARLRLDLIREPLLDQTLKTASHTWAAAVSDPSPLTCLTTGSDYERSHDLTGPPGIVTLPCVYPENNHRFICLD